MPAPFVPERGDIVWIQFDPQAGHEQAGHRPALVISPSTYNRIVGLGLFCPLTTRIKGFPFEVLLPPGLPASGAILSDQVKNLDWRARKAKFLCNAPADVVDEVLERILSLIDTD